MSTYVFPPYPNAEHLNADRLLTVPVYEDPEGTFRTISNNNPLPVSDPNLDMSSGDVESVSPFIISGECFSPVADVEVALWPALTELVHLTTAETLDIASTSGLDAGNLVFVSGLDADYNEVSDLVTIPGTTTQEFLRVREMVVITAVDPVANQGVITAVSSDTSELQDYMRIGQGVTRSWHFTVPAGKNFFVRQVDLGATPLNKRGLTAMQIEVRFFGGGRPWLSGGTFFMDGDTQIAREQTSAVWLDLPEKTDIRWKVTSSEDDYEIQARMYGYLVDRPREVPGQKLPIES